MSKYSQEIREELRNMLNKKQDSVSEEDIDKAFDDLVSALSASPPPPIILGVRIPRY